MARRKQQIADKLAQPPASRPGWRDTIILGQEPAPEEAPAAPEQRAPGSPPARQSPAATPSSTRAKRRVQADDDAIRRKTYLLQPELIDRIARLARRQRVGINDLVRFLLLTALEQVEEGEVEIPTRPGRRQITR